MLILDYLLQGHVDQAFDDYQLEVKCHKDKKIDSLATK